MRTGWKIFWTLFVLALLAGLGSAASVSWMSDHPEAWMPRALALASVRTGWVIQAEHISGSLRRHVVFDGVTLQEKEAPKRLIRLAHIEVDPVWKEIASRHVEADILVEGPMQALPLRLKQLHVQAHVSNDGIVVQKIQANVEGGHLEGRGDWDKVKNRTTFEGTTTRVPLHRLMALYTAVPPSLHLTHTGTWHIEQMGANRTIKTTGSLEGAPLNLTYKSSARGYQIEAQGGPWVFERLWREPTQKGSSNLTLHINASGSAFTFLETNSTGDILLQFPEKKNASLSLNWKIVHGKGEGRFELLDLTPLADRNVLPPKSSGKAQGVLTFTATRQKSTATLDFKVENLKIPEPSFNVKNVKGHLQAEIDKDHPVITGDVHVRDTVYTHLETKEKKVAAHVTSTPPAFWLKTKLDVQVEWPGRVYYREDLTNIETKADLRVQKASQAKDVVLTGQVGILRGQYDAYGRDFILDEGDITFVGRPENDPLLNIHAENRRSLMTIYLDVTGTAKKPQLQLRSNPPMTQQDIVSVLVTGKPLQEWAGSGSGSDPDRRAQALALVSQALTNAASRELRRKGMSLFALDMVQVESSPAGGSEVSIGRYIGERLFVTLKQPTQGAGTRTWNAEYTLTPHWTIDGQTGAANNGLDFMYRYPLNKGADKKQQKN